MDAFVAGIREACQKFAASHFRDEMNELVLADRAADWRRLKAPFAVHTGCDDAAVLAEMYEEMPGFKRLLDTAAYGGMDELCRRFPWFHRYAKILEGLAARIKSGRIKVPK